MSTKRTVQHSEPPTPPADAPRDLTLADDAAVTGGGSMVEYAILLVADPRPVSLRQAEP